MILATPQGRAHTEAMVVLPSDLIEDGRVCSLRFPLALNAGLAKAIGTMMRLPAVQGESFASGNIWLISDQAPPQFVTVNDRIYLRMILSQLRGAALS
jgi:hypothetical protein